MKKKQVFGIIFAMFVIILFTVLTIKYLPFFMRLKDEAYRGHVVQEIRDLKLLGVVVFLLLQVFQVIVAIIPGEVVEVMAGIIYGPWIGLLLCLIGIVIGSTIIYCLVKILGVAFVEKNVSKKEFKRFAFLNEPKRVEVILFFTFLVPMTPKDAVTYIVPLTKVSFPRFLVISCIARIPSILTSTYAGDNLLKGNLVTTIAIYSITFVVSLLCIVFRKSIINFIRKIKLFIFRKAKS